MYDRLLDLLIGEAAVSKTIVKMKPKPKPSNTEIRKSGKPVITRISGTGGGVRIEEPGKPVRFRSAGTFTADYEGTRVSAGVRAAQRATKMTARRSAPLSDKVP